jgi:UDPglucose 6-dehydrogenase
MGTVLPDFRAPEFYLIGTDGDVDLGPVLQAVGPLFEDPEVDFLTTSIESAELTKMAYNTFIGLKLTFANMLMEVCEGTGADVDEVSHVLEKATHRIASPSYLQAGMGDGGPCHPRDNLALSWLINRLGIGVDLPGLAIEARELQTRWMAGQVAHHHMRTGLPIFLLGKSYKAGSALTQGSPALLLAYTLEEHGLLAYQWDPVVDADSKDEVTPRLGRTHPALFVIATPHDEVLAWPFPVGSVVLDPWGSIFQEEVLDGVEVIRPGRKR